MLLYLQYDNRTPLFDALESGNVEIIETLLSAGANPNIASSVSNYKIKENRVLIELLIQTDVKYMWKSHDLNTIKYIYNPLIISKCLCGHLL